MIENNGEIATIYTTGVVKTKFGIPCLICGEMVELTEYELMYYKDVVKVCDKCKEAVMKMREKSDA